MAKKDKGRQSVVDEGVQLPALSARPAYVSVRIPWTSADWWLVGALTLASFLLHVWRLAIPNEQVFDEVYHARTALEFINGQEPYEWTHPPLGKLLIALGIRLFGFNGFGFRIVPCVFGALSVALLYVLAFHVFRNRFIAVLSGLLINLDGVFFVQSRVAMTNIIVYAFQLLTWVYLWRYLRRRRRTEAPPDDNYSSNYRTGWLHSNDFNLFMAGCGYGLAISTRWSANFLMGAMLLWLVWDRMHEWILAALSEKVKGRSAPAFWWRLGRRLPWGAMLFNALVLPYLLVAPYLLYLAGPSMFHLPTTLLKVGYLISLVPLLLWLSRSAGVNTAEASAGGLSRAWQWSLGLPLILLGLYAVAAYNQQPEWMKWNRLLPGLWWDFLWLYLWYTLPLFFFLLRIPSLQWASRIVFYLLFVPSVIYILTYIPWMQQQHSIWEVIWKQKDMWGYHAHLNAPHPYYSPWWSWPWMARPTWYYYTHNDHDTLIWGIDCIGNPAIWWASVPVMFILLLMVGYQYRGGRRPGALSLWLSVLAGLLGFGLTWVPLLFGPNPTPPGTFNIPKGTYFFEFIPFVWMALIVWAIVMDYRLGGPEHRLTFPSPLMFVVLGFAFAWLPWGLSPRQRIYMHYLFEGIPFACMGISYLLYLLWASSRSALGQQVNRYLREYWGTYLPESWQRALVERQAGSGFGKWLTGAYLMAALGLFVFFFPMLSAYPMKKEYYSMHIWQLPWVYWI